ncbi:MAG TPA: RNA-binding protein [Cytophagales bacterium]|nr:RNA-binding protein [Cytophagales bacterium]
MNIFIGNLSKQMDENNLHKIFTEFGLVNSVKVVKDSYTGKFRGFGFVEMVSEEDALNAIKSLNNKSFFGKRIMVNRRED